MKAADLFANGRSSRKLSELTSDFLCAHLEPTKPIAEFLSDSSLGANFTAGVREREDVSRSREAGAAVWETAWSVGRELYVARRALEY